MAFIDYETKWSDEVAAHAAFKTRVATLLKQVQSRQHPLYPACFADLGPAEESGRGRCYDGCDFLPLLNECET